VKELEERVKALEERPSKDRWDKFQLLASLLIPASITLCGYFFSRALGEAQIQSAEQLATRQEAIARLNTRLGQAQAVVSFIKSLLSPESQERKLAIEAILIALPEEGPRLVQIISVTDMDMEVKRFAGEAYTRRASQLLEGVMSSEAQKSDAAARDFARGYGSNPEEVKKLLEAAQPASLPQIAAQSTLQALEAVDPDALRTHRDAFDRFIRNHKLDSSQETKARVERIKKKL
jgi:hypothetical protein